ncbi:MAG: DNA-directed RNA polymerase subunit omega [Gammaproteobacteria bacterium]|jgi:DNA-directed RNA polymerase subunit omega
MARLTVEDCLEHINNRYDLVLLATKRARQLARGAEPLIEEDADKPTVIALREVSQALVTPENIDKLDNSGYDEDVAAELEFPASAE